MKLAVDIEAERAVLGSILLAPDAVAVAMELISPDDFSDSRNRIVYAAMAALARESKPIDTVTLLGYLRERDQLESVGFDALLGYSGSVASASNLTHYASTVRGRSRLRRLASAAAEIAEEAYAAQDPEEYIAEAQSRLLAMTEDARGDIVSAREWTVRAYRRLEARRYSDASPSLDCGLVALDRMRILRPGSLVTLAGRPGAGKTSLAQNIVLGAAERGARTFFVSIEMGDDEIENKFLGASAGVPTRLLEWPKYIRDEDWPRLARSLSAVGEQTIDLWVASSVHIDTLRVRARRVHAVRPIDLLVVDYLQLMRGERGDGRVQEVSSISRGLKILAKELNATVLALSQLNRDCEKRNPPIPMLSDIRESGSIEQDSDAVVFVYRPVMYDDQANPNDAKAIVAKNRHGPPGDAELYFEPQIQRFSDVEAPR